MRRWPEVSARAGGVTVANSVLIVCSLFLLRCQEQDAPPTASDASSQPDASLDTDKASAWRATCAATDPDAGSPGRVPVGGLLASATGWEPNLDDPFVGYRPDEVDCNNLIGWYVEDSELEVDTGECNYLSLTQPARAIAGEGMRVVARLLHFDLTAPEPTTGRVVLEIGQQRVFEYVVDIPGTAQVLQIDEPIAELVCPGTPVQLLVTNHGENTWRLSDLSIEY